MAATPTIPFLSEYLEHVGKRVFVYWNLHKKCWSIRHKGKVLFHAANLMLSDCTLKVSEKGRQRVLREGKKYVHAGVEGCLSVDASPQGDGVRVIGYNPRKGGTFFEYDSGMPILEAQMVIMQPTRKVIAI